MYVRGHYLPCTEADHPRRATVVVSVDHMLQEKFFEDVQRMLDDINSFFRAREAELAHQLFSLEREVHSHTHTHTCQFVHEPPLVLYPQVQNLPALEANDIRSTRKKRENLKLALSEFYLNLALLQNYQVLNHTGFRKILKKHDKLAKSDRGGHYHKLVVCNADFWTSQKVNKMIEQTETMMIENLEGGDRSKAMNRLRVPPLEARDKRSSWVTLRTGWLMGVIFVSIIVVGVAIYLRPLDSWEDLTPILRGLRAGFILTIWFYGFAINTYGWRKAGVNNVLIFEFDPRNYLNFIQLFEVSLNCGYHLTVDTYVYIIIEPSPVLQVMM